MVKKWNELKPGDRIFLMIPMAQQDSKYMLYQPQTAELIQSREKRITYDNTVIWSIKFKYSDVGGKRKPITLYIPMSEISQPTLCSNCKTLRRIMKYGEIICSNDEVSIARAYNELVFVKAKEIQKTIDAEYAALSRLTRNYISSETFNDL